MATKERAITSTRTLWLLLIRAQANANGTTNSLRTTCTIGMQQKRPCWWMPGSEVLRGSYCYRAIATDFFYVLDRATGKFLQATPFVRKLNWASKIGVDGRPALTVAFAPSETGTEICPSMDGATNWMSTAFHPGNGLFYLVALEKCNVFSKNSEWWKQGESFYGGAARPVAQERPRKFVRALDIETGKVAWEREQEGPGETWGGLLATAGGLLFSCEESGAFVALDARTGAPLWHFETNARWHASPMTYAVDGRQFLAVAAGPNIMAFCASGGRAVKSIIALALSAALVTTAQGAELTVTLPALLTLLRGEWQADAAMATMRTVYSTDRFFTFPKFAETARYLEATMRQAGLTNVEVIDAPADGVTQVGYWTEPLAWDAKSATLELLGSDVPARQTNAGGLFESARFARDVERIYGEGGRGGRSSCR